MIAISVMRKRKQAPISIHQFSGIGPWLVKALSRLPVVGFLKMFYYFLQVCKVTRISS